MLGYFGDSESELIHSPLPSGEGRGPILPAGSAVGSRGHDGRWGGTSSSYAEGSQAPLGWSL